MSARPRPSGGTTGPGAADAWTAVRLVAGRELRERGRSRPVLISTLVTLVGLVAAIALPNLLSDGERPSYDVGVVGGGDDLPATLALVGEQFDVDVVVRPVDDRAAADAAVRAGTVDAAFDVAAGELVVEEDPPEALRATTDLVLRQARVVDALADAGVSRDRAAALLSDDGGVAVVSLAPRDTDEREAGMALAFIGVILLFISVTANAGVILTATIEERASRVVEVLLATVRPWHLLTGKLLGVGVIALAQFTAFASVGLATAMLTSDFALPTGGTAAVVTSLAWFVLGFAFYATCYAVAGTLAGSIEDAQSTAAPMGFLLTGAYLVALLVVVPAPDGIAARVLALVPPFAPMVQPTRMVLTDVHAWEVALGVVVMLVGTAVTIRLAGRLYRAALLRGGGRLRLRDVWGDDG